MFDKAGRVKRSPSATFDSEQSVRLRENMHSPPEIDVNPLLEERETATRHVSYSFGDDFSDD